MVCASRPFWVFFIKRDIYTLKIMIKKPLKFLSFPMDVTPILELNYEIREICSLMQPGSEDKRFYDYFEKSFTNILFPNLPKEITNLISFHLHSNLYENVETSICYYLLCLEICWVFAHGRDVYGIRCRNLLQRLTTIKFSAEKIKIGYFYIEEIWLEHDESLAEYWIDSIERAVIFRLARLIDVIEQLRKFSFHFKKLNFNKYLKIMKYEEEYKEWFKRQCQMSMFHSLFDLSNFS